ncbi:MAG TPA: hypothetical protein DEH02_14675 [Bacteroidales bacterium]|nr:hypothetical protein [Bacteroidales bacterium]
MLVRKHVVPPHLIIYKTQPIMKILKLTIKNLNSIMGEYTIDFNKSPLSDMGLFAIIGETGAGKSTILDAISLAIYNSIPRGSSEDDIMSHGAWEAMAEVEFESGKKKYRSTWQRTRARKKPDGNLQNSTLKLADITDPNPDKHKTIAEKKKDIEKEIIEITGLDVDKFKQSVLLAQGEFAAFMKADPGRRGELLEKITQQTDYSKYSIAAYNKYKEEKNKLDQLLINLENYKTLNNEEKQEIFLKIETEKTETSKLEILRNDVLKSILWLDAIIEKEKEKLQAENKYKATEDNLKNADEIKLRKEAHESTIPFFPDLALLDESEANFKKINELIFNYEKSLPAINEKYQKEKELHDKTELLINNLLKEIEIQEPLFTHAATLDESIKNTQEKYNKIKDEEIFVAKKLNEISEKIQKNKIHHAKYSEKISEIEKWLVRYDHYKNIPEIKGRVVEKLNAYNNLHVEKIKKEKALEDVKIQLTETGKRNNIIKKNLPELQSNIDKINAELEKLKKIKTELFAESDLSSLKNEFEKLELKKNALQNLSRISQEWSNKKISWEENTKKDQEQIYLTEKCCITKEETEMKIKMLEEYIITLEQKKEVEILIKNYEEDRKKLKDGMPCFLCGATTHPFANGNGISSTSETENKIKEKKVELKKATKDLLETIQSIPSKTAMEQLTNTITKEKNEIQKLENDFEKFKTEIQIPNIRVCENEELTINLNHSITNTENLKKRISQIEKNNEKIYQKENNLKNQTQELHNFQLNLQESEMKLQELSKIGTNAISEIEQISKQLEEYNKSITLALQPFDIAFNEDKTEAAISTLVKHENEYKKTTAEKSELGEKIQILNAEITGDEKALQNLKDEEYPRKIKEIEDVKNNLTALTEERKHIFNNRKIEDVKKEYKEKLNVLNEQFSNQQKQVKEITEKLTQTNTLHNSANEQKQHQEEIIQTLKNKLLNNIQNIFQSIEDVRKNIMEKTGYEKLKKQYEDVINEYRNAKVSLETISKQLTEEKEKKITEDSKENLELKKIEIETKYNEIKERISDLTQKLKQDEEIRQKYSAEVSRIEAQQQELKRWDLLNKVIGSADGDEFRKYAQSITMRQLTEIANKHLERISGRYNVIMLKNKKRIKNLELDIEDRFQGNNIRPMDTLSGGETFLVSLALALGLSEMASSKNPVESLFIDEGFGSLDPATLDMALSALENLQSSGKTIGIISHVGLLKERIPCQVQVIKKGSGISEIKIV